MGLFKSMKDMAELTKTGKEMQKQQQEQAGYKPGFGGMMDQMGDMLADANEQLKDISGKSGDRERVMKEGAKGKGIIVGMGTPERGAQWFNMNLDMEIRVPRKKAYKINQQYMVPAGAQLGPGVELPIFVDKEDPKRIEIDWQSAPRAAAEGEIRPA